MRCRSQLLRALDNNGDGVSSTFPKGKLNGDKLLINIIHKISINMNNIITVNTLFHFVYDQLRYEDVDG
jgi:hypothetical protein